MDRKQLFEQHTKDILALRLDTHAEIESAKQVARMTSLLSPQAHNRYIREVQEPSVKKHTHSRGFRKLHTDLIEGAARILDEQVNASLNAVVREPEEVTS